MTTRISQTPAEIVTARVIQGVGAGMFYPAIGATIQLAFTGPARSKAFGVLGAVIGVSTALGPTLGGVIIGLAATAIVIHVAAPEPNGWYLLAPLRSS